jgi:Tol biopolymer transport system component
MKTILILITTTLINTSVRAADPGVDNLKHELGGNGWITFSAATGSGQWDLFQMRPDGSDRRQLTDTREFSETGARVSPDGHRMLYYRQPAADAVDNNTYGTFELIIADTTSGKANNLGNAYSWASWGPDDKNVAALTAKGIVMVDVGTLTITRTLPRHGIVQQLGWSDDGRYLVGTANGLGQYWNIGVLDIAAGKFNAVSETERYNCTPDWVRGSCRIVYARGIVPNDNGRAELWLATSDGKDKHMLYAESDRHIYGGATSPDGKYLLFTRSEEDLGKVDHTKTTIAIIRTTDSPMLANPDSAASKRHPDAKPALRFDLGPGWEPCWTTTKCASVKSVTPAKP